MALDRKLGGFQLWAITVGMVISGQFFGWNYALQHTNAISLLIAFCMVSLFYVSFIFCCAELATMIPNAGGPYAYVARAFGNFPGYLTGVALLIEYGFAVPAITVATGSYCHFLLPDVSAQAAGSVILLLLIAINLLSTKSTAQIELIATILALICLSVYDYACFHVLQHHWTKHLQTRFSLSNIAMTIPFLCWIFLGVEGSVTTAEEIKNPKRNLSRGLCMGMITLLCYSIFTIFFTYLFTPSMQTPVDFPLPKVMATQYGAKSFFTLFVAGLGLFGLVASLNGLLIALSREVFAFSRAGNLPHFFSRLSKSHVPTYAILIPGVIALLCSYSAHLANALVGLSVAGAIIMYLLTLCAHIKLRIKDKKIERPFKAWFPIAPIIGLLLGLLCCACIFKYVLIDDSLTLFNRHIPLAIIASSIFIFFIWQYQQRQYQ